MHKNYKEMKKYARIREKYQESMKSYHKEKIESDTEKIKKAMKEYDGKGMTKDDKPSIKLILLKIQLVEGQLERITQEIKELIEYEINNSR